MATQQPTASEPNVRTVVVKSPTAFSEAGLLLRALQVIAVGMLIVIGVERAAFAPKHGGRGPAQLIVGEVAFAELAAGDQREWRRISEGLGELEDGRSRTGEWQTPEAMKAKGIPPFADDPIDAAAGYQWKMLRLGDVINYVGTPLAASGRATWLIVLTEPAQGTPIDPTAVADETHYKLPDGSILHVSGWIGAGVRQVDRPIAFPAPEEGWRRVTGGPQPTSQPAVQADAGPRTAAARPLRVGVTLHPYYSWTKNIVGDLPGVEVVPILPGEVDAGSYQPSPDDIAKIATLDALVVNGIGHDDFVGEMVEASGNTHLLLIRANDDTPTVKSVHGDAPNSHTFISFTNAIQQTRLIEKKLDELRPEYTDAFHENASAYIERLRGIQTATAGQLAGAKIKRVVTVHEGYTYLLQELGIELAGVVEPSHGLTPSAKELGELIELMRKEHVTVVFTEEAFPQKLLDTLEQATGAKVYIISHIAMGTYSADEFDKGMQANADVLVKALVTDAR